MKKDRWLLVGVSLIVLLFFVSALGFAEGAKVRVTCVDDSGKPLKGVTVELLPLGGGDKSDEKSNKAGVAEFKKVDEGVYRVVGRKKDYGPEFYEFLKVGSSPESVSLKFDKGLDRKFYFEDPLIIQRSYDLMTQGTNASKENRFADAEKLLRESIRLNPANSQGYYLLGVFFFRLGKFDQGVEFLEKAEKLADMFAALPPAPGRVDPAQEAKIRDDARQLIKNVPSLKGQIALDAKKYDEAIQFFSQASKADPGNPEAHYDLALALAHAGRFDEAMKEIDESIRLRPGDKGFANLKRQITVRIENAGIEKANTLIKEADELLKNNDAAGALEKFREALKLLSPGNQAPVFRSIGKAQADLNQKEEAEASLKKAVELAPEDQVPDYLKSLAQFYLDSKDYENALNTLTDPRVTGGESKEKVLLDLVEKSKNQSPKLAEDALERVLADNPGNTEAYFTLGQMYFADGKQKDPRTKELLKKYIEIGKNQENIGLAKDMLTTIEWRSK